MVFTTHCRGQKKKNFEHVPQQLNNCLHYTFLWIKKNNFKQVSQQLNDCLHYTLLWTKKKNFEHVPQQLKMIVFTTHCRGQNAFHANMFPNTKRLSSLHIQGFIQGGGGVWYLNILDIQRKLWIIHGSTGHQWKIHQSLGSTTELEVVLFPLYCQW